jgi:16S rRNA (cytidine1402-2'-O)-methyltransferase
VKPARGAVGTLYLLPSLLGAVEPASVLPGRTMTVARRLRHFVVETPKTARAFVKSLPSEHALQDIVFAELNEHTPAHRVAELLAPALKGDDLALVSALLLAMMASGMNGQDFAFHGYLPVRANARATALRKLDDAVTRSGATQLFIETPYRNEAMVAAVLRACRPQTRFCVAADLTLATEQVISRSIAEWRAAPKPGLSGRPAMFLLGTD